MDTASLRYYLSKIFFVMLFSEPEPINSVEYAMIKMELKLMGYIAQ